MLFLTHEGNCSPAQRVLVFKILSSHDFFLMFEELLCLAESPGQL